MEPSVDGVLLQCGLDQDYLADLPLRVISQATLDILIARVVIIVNFIFATLRMLQQVRGTLYHVWQMK